MITGLLVASVLAASTPAPAANLARLSWLAGCWSRTNPRRIVEEQWMAPASGLMLGSGRTRNVADGALVEFEQTRIEARVWEVPEVAAARTLLIYASLPEEVATDGIADEARRRGITLVYPRCLPGGVMTLHAVDVPDALRPGRFGTRERP
jgi:hypothetical protein